MLGERPRQADGGGGVAWTGDARSLMRANLRLRTASRVLVRVTEFHATAFHELEKRAKGIEWDRWLAPGVTPEFRVTARKSKLYHSDAIAERLTRSVPRATRQEAVGSQLTAVSSQLFVVRAERDHFTVSADSSGELLHRRGYRLETAKAPLRETLAAALLLASEWSGDEALIDPFCGSGTIPIEGALIARRLAPGRHRDFAFTRWPRFDAAGWRALLADADAEALASAPARIAGSDRDAGAVQSARANADRAGVAGDIAFSVGAVSSARPPAASGRGLVATNPPYGKRIGRAGGRDVRDVYAQLGNVLRRHFAGWRVSFFAPDDRLAAQLSLPLTRLFHTTNGGLRVGARTAGVADSASETAGR